MTTGTTIDALVLEFGLDHRQFTRDQREVLEELRRFEREAEKTGGRAEQQGRKVVDVMSSFRREALSAVGLFLGGRGIKEFIGYMSQLDASTGKAALTFNMSARELSAWQGAMEQSGGRAEAMRGTLGGLTQDMNRFMLTGQGTLASVLRPIGVDMYDANKNLKDASTLILDIVGALDAKGLDPARRAAYLSMIPGMNEDSINLMMRSRRELEEMVNTSRRLGGTTAESAKQMQDYQQATANLDRSMTSLGRNLLTLVAPALSATASSLAKLFAGMNVSADSPEGKARSANNRADMIRRFGSPKDFLLALADPLVKGGKRDAFGDWLARKAEEWYGPGDSDAAGALKAAESASAGSKSTAPRRQPAGSSSEVISYIRQAAVARGIDPDVAVRVAKSEGLYNYIGDKGSSFGPFQLHYGGVAPGMMQSGLGDAFTKKTGLNARDETTWRDQIDFALDHAKNSGRGWADWYGARNTGIGQFAGIGGKGGGSSSVTNNIGTVVINTQATDAKGIADDIKPQLERGSFTSQFNSGAE